MNFSKGCFSRQAYSRRFKSFGFYLGQRRFSGYPPVVRKRARQSASRLETAVEILSNTHIAGRALRANEVEERRSNSVERPKWASTTITR